MAGLKVQTGSTAQRQRAMEEISSRSILGGTIFDFLAPQPTDLPLAVGATPVGPIIKGAAGEGAVIMRTIDRWLDKKLQKMLAAEAKALKSKHPAIGAGRATTAYERSVRKSADYANRRLLIEGLRSQK